MVIVPALPVTVELNADQYYYQNGYYYRMTAAFGSTRKEEKDLGWICREATIPEKSATGAAMIIMAIVTTNNRPGGRRNV